MFELGNFNKNRNGKHDLRIVSARVPFVALGHLFGRKCCD